MIYDIINILNGVLILVAIYNWLGVLKNNRGKGFEPPSVRARMFHGTLARLGITCFFLGAVARAFATEVYHDAFSVILSLVCATLVFYSSVEFKAISEEKEVTMKDI